MIKIDAEWSMARKKLMIDYINTRIEKHQFLINYLDYQKIKTKHELRALKNSKKELMKPEAKGE